MATYLILSDLHLSGGAADPWNPIRQKAFEEITNAAMPGQSFADDSVELIFNGDTFDFLNTPPSLANHPATDVATAHEKWSAIALAHDPWFQALRKFTAIPGRKITFLIGNHDLELWYPSIRARIRSAIHAAPGLVQFCLTQSYQPRTDLVIAHGCQQDIFNYIPNIWEADTEPSGPDHLERNDMRTAPVGDLKLPWGSRYYYQIMQPMLEMYPYLIHMNPELTLHEQIALFCLLQPKLAEQNAAKMQNLVTSPIHFPSFSTGDIAQLFADITQLQNQIIGELRETVHIPASNSTEEYDRLLNILKFSGVSDALRRIITTPHAEYPVQLAPQNSAFYIYGHTHFAGRWRNGANQTAINTGTWIPQFTRPKDAEWNPEFEQWFMQPNSTPYPGADTSRLTLAWTRAYPHSASSTELIEWKNGSFILV